MTASKGLILEAFLEFAMCITRIIRAKRSTLRRAVQFMVGVYLLCLGPSPTAAQVNGHVVDEVNAPVQGATVELWSPTRRLVARLSDAEGRFSFPASDMGGAVGALAHRIGMRAAQASLAPGDGELVLRRRVAAHPGGELNA